MKWILIGTLLFLTINDIVADKPLECYICEPATSECKVADATTVKCGNQQTSKCTREIKSGATDVTKALRKCAVPDSKGNVPCTQGYECSFCNTDLCNSGSTFKFTWISVVGVLFSILYLN